MTVTAAPPLVDTVSSSVTSNYDADVHQGPPDAQQLLRHHRAVADGERSQRGQWPVLGLRRQRDVAAVEHRRPQPGLPRGRLAGLEHQPRDRGGDVDQGVRGRSRVRQHDGQRLQPGDQVRDQRAPRIGRRLLDDNSLVDPNVKLDTSNLWAYRLWDPAGRVHHRRVLRHPRDPRRADPQRQAVVLRRRPVGRASTSWVPTACRDSKAAARPTTATTSSSPPRSATAITVDVRGHTANTKMVPAPDMFTALSAVIVYDIDIEMLTGDYNGALTAKHPAQCPGRVLEQEPGHGLAHRQHRGGPVGCHLPWPTAQPRRDLLVQRPQGEVHPGRRGGVALRRRLHQGEPRVQVRRPVQRGQRREERGQVHLRVEAAAEPGVRWTPTGSSATRSTRP